MFWINIFEVFCSFGARSSIFSDCDNSSLNIEFSIILLIKQFHHNHYRNIIPSSLNSLGEFGAGGLAELLVVIENDWRDETDEELDVRLALDVGPLLPGYINKGVSRVDQPFRKI